MNDPDQDKSDMEFLLNRGEFRRFLFAVIQKAGIWEATTDGSVERTFLGIGRRQLGLEILDMAELGQPVAHPDKIPVMTLLQVLREETQQPQEKPNAKGRTSQYNRQRELDEPSDDDADDASRA
jgi:hypothetical protein